MTYKRHRLFHVDETVPGDDLLEQLSVANLHSSAIAQHCVFIVAEAARDSQLMRLFKTRRQTCVL